MRKQTAERVRRGEVPVSAAPASIVVQPKLRVGPADDAYEREADRVAAQVVQRLASAVPATGAVDQAGGGDPAQRLQRRHDPGATGGHGHDEAGHGPEGGAAAPHVERALGSGGGGNSLDPGVRSTMETGFGVDLGHVRVHTDATSADLNRSLNSRAFTKGNDIYFGRGEYRPGSQQGQMLLAHEITHTIQQGGGVQRKFGGTSISHDPGGTVRRWDLSKKIDLANATRIEPVKSGQSVFMVDDGGGDRIVIKAESEPVNIMQLAALVHKSVHDTDAVNAVELEAGQKQIFLNKIGDPTVAKGDNWAIVGASWKSWNKDGADDAAHGRRGHQEQVARLSLQAQKLAPGKDAKGLAKDTGKTGMKQYLESPVWMRKLGAATAADLLLGNADRVRAGNLGNWMTTAEGKVTLIDNMDATAKNAMYDPDNVFTDDLKDWGNNPSAFLASSIDALLLGANANSGGAFDYVAWADEPGALRRHFMTQDFTTGFDDARKKIITKYVDTKSSKEGRALKQAVKSTEVDNQLDPWEVLKARARFLKDPKKAASLLKTLRQRSATREKKLAKKKA